MYAVVRRTGSGEPMGRSPGWDFLLKRMTAPGAMRARRRARKMRLLRISGRMAADGREGAEIAGSRLRTGGGGR